MQKNSGKFLVDWIDGLSRQQVFSMFWVAIGVFFLFVFWRQYQRVEQRNFREGGGGKPTPKKGTAVVVSGERKKIENSK